MILLVFPLIPFFWSRSQSKVPREFSCHVYLVSSSLDSYLFLSFFIYLDVFEVSVILQNFLQCRFVWCFLMIRLKLGIFNKSATGDALHFSVHHIMASIFLITGDVNVDHLVKVVSVRCLHCKGTLFPFIIDKYLVERYPVLIQFLPTNFSILHRLFLQQLLPWCLLNNDFLFPMFLLFWLIGILM